MPGSKHVEQEAQRWRADACARWDHLRSLAQRLRRALPAHSGSDFGESPSPGMMLTMARGTDHPKTAAQVIATAALGLLTSLLLTACVEIGRAHV